MTHYDDKELAELAADNQAALKDRDHKLYDLIISYLIEDLREARAENKSAFRNRLVAAHEVDQTVDTLRATIEQQAQTIAELIADNQQLAQTVKDMDAGYQRNIERFTKIREMTQTILFHARLSLIDEDRVASIKTWALEGEKEEGDNA